VPAALNKDPIPFFADVDLFVQETKS
jgi:hypothetical protein